MGCSTFYVLIRSVHIGDEDILCCVSLGKLTEVFELMLKTQTSHSPWAAHPLTAAAQQKDIVCVLVTQQCAVKFQPNQSSLCQTAKLRRRKKENAYLQCLS